MARRDDLDMEDLNTGPVPMRLSRNYRKKYKKDQVARSGKFCIDCGKQGYATEEAAREVIGNVAKYGHLQEAGSFAVRPYLCAHGWWHFGRNRKALQSMKQFLQKKNAPKPTLNSTDRRESR